MRKLVIGALVSLIGLALIVQLVPYGRDHTNPLVTAEPTWDSPVTRQLAVRACYACHSNQTVWPWYSNIAPVSWLVQSDVDGGRHSLNFSEWNRPQEEPGEAAEKVAEGEMPPWFYTILRPSSGLSDAERRDLIAGLEVTLGKGEGTQGERDHEKREDYD
ncbi:MAG: heme-binding domain-containing protein [SAR202 cluster bacterium]|nr:heme-binding domain-containing protein [SAR202 cluster bacterium]